MKKHHSDTFVGAFPHEHAIRLWGDPDEDGRIMWIDFQIIVVASQAEDGQRSYPRKGATTGPDLVDSLDDAEAEVEGFIKWDGCTQFSADIHIDDRDGLDVILQAIQTARRLAAQAIGWDIVHEYDA